MRETMRQPEYAVQFLNPGRLAHVVDGEDDWGWGVIVNFQKKANSNRKVLVPEIDGLIAMIVHRCKTYSFVVFLRVCQIMKR